MVLVYKYGGDSQTLRSQPDWSLKTGIGSGPDPSIGFGSDPCIGSGPGSRLGCRNSRPDFSAPCTNEKTESTKRPYTHTRRPTTRTRNPSVSLAVHRYLRAKPVPPPYTLFWTVAPKKRAPELFGELGYLSHNHGGVVDDDSLVAEAFPSQKE